MQSQFHFLSLTLDLRQYLSCSNKIWLIILLCSIKFQHVSPYHMTHNETAHEPSSKCWVTMIVPWVTLVFGSQAIVPYRLPVTSCSCELCIFVFERFPEGEEAIKRGRGQAWKLLCQNLILIFFHFIFSSRQEICLDFTVFVTRDLLPPLDPVSRWAETNKPDIQLAYNLNPIDPFSVEFEQLYLPLFEHYNLLNT